MASHAGELTVSEQAAGTVCLLTVEGVLDSSSYLKLRDAVIKAALDEPRAVLVDVDGLVVPASSAWSVFTSARWHVSTWPDVPIALICSHAARRASIAHTGVTRYVPVHASAEAALNALTGKSQTTRRRARAELPASLASLHKARELVAEHLAAWSQSDLIPVATVVVNALVENVLQHTASSPVVVLESKGATVTVSVQDCSTTPATRHEDPIRGSDRVSGLAIVAAVSRAWGSTPTPSGKAVWAVMGPENRL
ncbi:sulfate transporter [Mycobacterium sp. MFM001]|uniref:ATP-binding protein n=1 Tax=Mycobacterium sp. MFM001 TaxID=2049453 RepID=UPI000DA44D92|nr:ATP-binding protein [Mycobacterium sp. MFM001]GBE64729.1 sulfate transporter [Mycobacterium sp. MFM001]